MKKTVTMSLKQYRRWIDEFNAMCLQLDEVRAIMADPDELYLDDQRAMNEALHEVMGLEYKARKR